MPRGCLTDRLVAVLAVALLAAFGMVAAAADRDLDGVPDERDSCPNLPNEPGPSGAQVAICGAGFREAIRRHVFLDSRTLAPRDGIDPALTADGGVRRVMLHIRRDDRLVLTTAQRAQLRAAGVRLWDYLPRYTYLATVPATRQGLAAVVRLPFVQGMSALEPRDRISRSLRRTQGGP
ncbi:MAG TPA: hypothetical protein VFY87_11895, partial [Geminicoccaceae bacterium]|nr:hypothetical protein [Geminicoccaceae bacterium]